MDIIYDHRYRASAALIGLPAALNHRQLLCSTAVLSHSDRDEADFRMNSPIFNEMVTLIDVSHIHRYTVTVWQAKDGRMVLKHGKHIHVE